MIRAVAQRENIEATDADVSDEIERLLEGLGEVAEEQRKQLEDPETRESIRRMLVQRRTLEYLSSLALRDTPAAAKPKARAAASKSGGAKPRQTKTPARQTRARRQQGGANDA